MYVIKHVIPVGWLRLAANLDDVTSDELSTVEAYVDNEEMIIPLFVFR